MRYKSVPPRTIAVSAMVMLASISLGSCAQPSHWYKDGMTKSQEIKDESFCAEKSSQSASSDAEERAQAAAGYKMDQIFAICMESRGYNER